MSTQTPKDPSPARVPLHASEEIVPAQASDEDVRLFLEQQKLNKLNKPQRPECGTMKQIGEGEHH